MLDLGIVTPGSTLRIPFATFDSNDPSASVTMTGFAVTDVEIFKDGSTTQRASDSGYTATTDFDAITGTHLLVIDLADNTTAGFWSAGSEYLIQVASVTVDAATINFWAARFRIGYDNAILNTSIATLASQTSFTLTVGPAEDDALNGCIVVIHDVASAVQFGFGVVSDYTGATKTVTLTAGVTFTAAATDNISFFTPSNAAYGGGVAYTATRGLAGTALPAAAADAAGGMPISDAGGLDLDAKLANTNEVTAARMGALTDWINGGRLDLILDAAATAAGLATHDSKLDTLTTTVGAAGAGLTEAGGTGDHLTVLSTAAELAKVPKSDGTATWNATALASIQTEAEDALQSHHVVLVKTTIATLASQTSFTLTAGSADNDAYNGCEIVIEDAVTAAQKAVGVVSDYVGATKTVTLKDDPAVFVMAVSDVVTIRPSRSLKPTVDNRTLDVSTGGEGGIDWANVGTPGSTVGLSATTVGIVTTNTDMRGTDSAALATVCTEARLAELDAANLPATTDAILVDTGTTLDGRIPAALVGGRMDSNLGSISADATAADRLEACMDGVVTGAAEAGTLSTTQMTTDLAEATNDHYIGRIVTWLTGVLAGQSSDITDYAGANGLLTFTAVTESPSAGDTFVIT